MTYNARKDQLLLASVQASNAFIDVVIAEGQSHSDRYKAAHQAWESAEYEYVEFLKRMETEGKSPEDRLRPVMRSIQFRLRDIAAIFV